MKKLLPLFFISMISFSIQATEVEWNFNSLYTVDANGFTSIISDARNHFDTFPNDTIIVHINTGTYQIDGVNNIGINFNQGLLSESAQGRLIFQGAGMYETTLVFTDKNDDMIKGSDVYHLEFRDMFMTRPEYSVSQGTIVSVSAGEVVLDIEQGFPSPYDLFAVEGGGGRFDAGRYLRKYDNSNKLDPLVILDNNRQISWGWRNGAPVYPVEDANVPNRWSIFLNNASTVVSYYAPGDYLGIKSKSEGHIYWFSRGSDLVFRNIRWRNSSRGLVRGGFSNVGLYGCRIEREDPINGQMPCMSTPSGGPQMNQDGDPVSTNMVFEDCYFDSPGDDNIAFFNVNGGRVKNTTVRNGFARGILATVMASNICLDNVVIDNAYIENGPLGLDHDTAEEAIVAGGAYNDDCVTTGVISATGVNLNLSESTLNISETTQLIATVLPTNATDKTVIWTSNNDSIATVDASGLVTAVGNGSATITVTTNDGGFTATSIVTVNDTDVVIHEGYFESGWDGWIDGGRDCARRAEPTRSFEGDYSIRIRDNSGVLSSMTSPTFDLSSFNSVEFNFYFLSKNMEVGEDFWLQYNDGSGFVTIETWARGTDFNNNDFGNYSILFDATQYNLSSNAQFRLLCDASSNNDEIYIDQVVITGSGSGGAFFLKDNDTSKRGTITESVDIVKNTIFAITESVDIVENTIFKNKLTLFPNPVEDVLNIKTLKGGNMSYIIINALGQIVNVGKTTKEIIVDNLEVGMYYIEVINGEDKMMKRFIKE